MRKVFILLCFIFLNTFAQYVLNDGIKSKSCQKAHKNAKVLLDQTLYITIDTEQKKLSIGKDSILVEYATKDDILAIDEVKLIFSNQQIHIKTLDNETYYIPCYIKSDGSAYSCKKILTTISKQIGLRNQFINSATAICSQELINFFLISI